MRDGRKLMKNYTKFCVKNRIRLLYALGFFLFAAACVSGIVLGSSRISLLRVFKELRAGAELSSDWRILFYVRIPRCVATLVCGAALATSGAVIQSVLANRLASPGIIGVNAGAYLAVTLCTALGIFGGWRLYLFAFAGAFFSVMAVSLGARKWDASRGTVILIGVAMNSLLGAVSDAIITLIPDAGVMSNNFRIGEFSSVTYHSLIPVSILVVFSLLVLLTLSESLDVLTLGDENAKALGLNTSAARAGFLVLAAMLAGCAVSIAGLLSFVGLIVPNIIRRLTGTTKLHLIVLCAVYGAAFVSICDTAARCLFSPYEIPVGIIMAFLGAPFFLFILIKGKGGHKND